MQISAFPQWSSRARRHQRMFGDDLARTNTQRIIFLAAVVFPICIAHALVFLWLEPITDNEAQWRLGLIGFHGVVTVLMGLLAAIICWTRQSNIRDRLISYAGLATVLLSGVVVTLMAQQISGAITPFVIACILAGTLFLVSPFQALIAYGSALLLYLLVLDGSQAAPAIVISNRVNGITAAAFAFGLSTFLWHQAIQSQRQKHITQAQQHQLQQANSRLAAQAAIDELTGLTNRRMLTLLLGQELAAIKRNKTPACLLILDIDYFKAINDQHGHLQGDNVLQQFAQLMKSSVRASDHVCRWGGEEFAILLRNTGLQAARHVAETLRQRISNHTFMMDAHAVTLTASMGVTGLNPEQPDALMQAYQRADQMLYEAKGAGRNQIRAA